MRIVVAWILALSIVGGLVLLVWFFPLAAAVLFISCLAFVSFAVGRASGLWRGIRHFIKEILFGW